MTALNGYDYTNVSPSVLKADGAKFVIRYLGTSSKCITLAEKKQLQADGVAIGLVYETSGVTFSGGERSGMNDGSSAKSAALKLGAPPASPIYFAIDTDTNEYTVVNDYLKGCQEGCSPYVAKLYGGYNVIQNAPGDGHWQTYAWSSGRVSAKADLYQYLNGSTLDHDRTLGSTLGIKNGWLVPGGAPAPAPSPTPAPAPKPVPQPTVHVDAVSHAKAESAHASRNWHDECLVFVRTCFGLAADGREPTAASAWGDCPAGKRHAGDAHPPANVPVIWSGGSSGAGHAAVSAGGGKIWSTDIVRTGGVDEVDLTEIHAKWGLQYLGWMEELEGHVIYAGPAPAPGPIPIPVHPPVPGGSHNGSWTNFPGSTSFRIGKANPAVWVLGVRLAAAGFDKHVSVGHAKYAPSHVFELHDLRNVRDFQRAQGWSGANADGYPGPHTWGRLGEESGWIT